MRLLELPKMINIITLLLTLCCVDQANSSEKESDEYNSSNCYKDYSRELRSFDDFKIQCEKGEQQLVMVFGAGSTNGFYKENIYRVDVVEDFGPDLLMNTDIKNLPEKYIGQFDVVVFECICSSKTSCANYEREKAFPNVIKLLKKDGLFLVWTDNSDDIKEQQEALKEYGFTFKERIKRHNISLMREFNNNPPRPDCDNIYLEPNGNEIKYTVITSDNRVEGSLNISINLEELFSSNLTYLNKQLLESKILNELLQRGQISKLSYYKDYLGGVCIFSYADLLVMKKIGGFKQ